MPAKNSKPGSSAHLRMLIAVAAIGCFALAWWFMRPPIKLNKDHYATTIALYRVCNQRSEIGLDQIETLLAASDLPPGEEDASLDAILTIIADARKARWKQAAQDCRHLLDSQVQR
jgi:hypothetical protein